MFVSKALGDTLVQPPSLLVDDLFGILIEPLFLELVSPSESEDLVVRHLPLSVEVGRVAPHEFFIPQALMVFHQVQEFTLRVLNRRIHLERHREGRVQHEVLR